MIRPTSATLLAAAFLAVSTAPPVSAQSGSGTAQQEVFSPFLSTPVYGDPNRAYGRAPDFQPDRSFGDRGPNGTNNFDFDGLRSESPRLSKSRRGLRNFFTGGGIDR